uniref:Uncharacterized protein n=1 Tax=Octopus bimaculoides TaxID=37653 RepID=A0A0L8I404_OCTBM
MIFCFFHSQLSKYLFEYYISQYSSCASVYDTLHFSRTLTDQLGHDDKEDEMIGFLLYILISSLIVCGWGTEHICFMFSLN